MHSQHLHIIGSSSKLLEHPDYGTGWALWHQSSDASLNLEELCYKTGTFVSKKIEVTIPFI